ncbi:MAG: GTPase RsgA, partial [Actinomycetes bacterium]
MAGLPQRITSGMTGGADEGNDVELEEIGLDAGFVEVAISQGIVPRSLGRVVRMDRGWASVQRRTALDRLELRDCPQIAVGDWIGLDGTGANVRVERRSALVRRSVSERVEAQYMAANVDLVVIVYALDTEISDSRLTELIVMARDSGAEPLVVLTKADKSDDLEGVLHRVEEIAAGIEVIVVSSVTAMGLERFRDFVRNKTIVLLGASGAGKSTLTNALLLAEAQETGEVRRKGEGRHTTTSRQLLGIP